MHFYQFHIGDYAAHTGHLDHFEDLAYRRMLDWCYLHERQLPNDIPQISRLIRMPTHCDCIANVLREFFELDSGWWQTRIGKELSTVAEKSQKNSASAKARWAKEKGHTNALPTQCERNATQDPRTKTQEPYLIQEPKGSMSGAKLTDGLFDKFWKAYPRKVGKDAARKAFDKRKPDSLLVDRMLAAVGQQASGWNDVQFIPHPATWLNAGRWEDEVATISAKPVDWRQTLGGVQEMASKLGLPMWDQMQQFPIYRREVIAAADARGIN